MPDLTLPGGAPDDVAALDAFIDYMAASGTSTDVMHLAQQAITVLRARFPTGSAAYYELEGGLWKARAWSNDIQGDLLDLITAGLPETPLIREVLQAGRVVFRDAWEPGREEVNHSEEYGSVANYPLLHGGEVHGILALALRDTRRWSHQDRALVVAVGRSLTLALERAEQARQLLEERQALAAFADFTEAVSRAADVPTLLGLAFAMLPTRFPQAAVGYFEPAGDLWKLTHHTGEIPEAFLLEARQGLALGRPLILDATQNSAPLFMNDWDAARAGVPGSAVFGKVAFYPLTVNDAVRAVLVFGVQGLRRWGERDQALVRAIGRSLSLAYERTVTTDVLQQQRAELEARTRALEGFAALSRDLTRSSDPHTLVRTAQEVVRGLLPDGYAVYYELHGDTWRATVQTGDLGNPQLQAVVDAGLPYASADTLVAPWTTHQPVYQDQYDVTTDNLYDLVAHVSTAAGLPVLVRGAPVGVFVVGLFGVRYWTPVDRAMLEGVVRSLGLALESAQHAAQLLERSREVSEWRDRYELAVRGSGHLLYDWDPVTDHIVYGGAVEEVTGYAPDDLDGSLDDWTRRLIHPEDRAGFSQEIERVIGSHDNFQLTFRVVRRDGRIIEVEDDGYFRRDEAGNVTRMVGFVRDVTERNRTLTALRRSNAELEQFASVASHDLQTPIRAVTSFAGALSRRYADVLDERGRTYLRQIEENGEHMKRLVDDLLTYARVSRAERPLQPTDMNAVFDTVVDRLMPGMMTGATVVRGELPTVLADTQQLDQLLQNLIGNGLKYHRPGVAPRVEVTAEREQGEWRFMVRDNGLGIEPQYQERIFEMFQRLHRRDEYEGTGVGLAVCQKIVNQHGGYLWVESLPGQGSTFFFTLPGVDLGQDPR